MRLFLLPINSRNTLIYAQRLNNQLTSKQSQLEKLTIKASERWVLWESYEKGWQKKVTQWGNQLFARIPYQEWGLKSIPPLSARRQADEIKGNDKVELLYPASIIPETKIPETLRKLALDREAFHRQRMIWCVVGMPFTIPFAIVPVIPNLPFFYVAFRAWSHWRAFSGSQHIKYLMDNKLIQYSQSTVLQKIYDIGEIPKELIKPIKDSLSDKSDMAERTKAFTELIEAEDSSSTSSKSIGEDDILASKSTGHMVSLCFGVPQVDAEMERAIQQVKKQIDTEKTATKDQPQTEDKRDEVKK